jgi:hypothetical protein
VIFHCRRHCGNVTSSSQMMLENVFELMTFAIPESQKHTMFFQWDCIKSHACVHQWWVIIQWSYMIIDVKTTPSNAGTWFDPREDANHCWHRKKWHFWKKKPYRHGEFMREKGICQSFRREKTNTNHKFSFATQQRSICALNQNYYKSKNNNYLEVFGLFGFQQYIKMSFVKELLLLL